VFICCNVRTWKFEDIKATYVLGNAEARPAMAATRAVLVNILMDLLCGKGLLSLEGVWFVFCFVFLVSESVYLL